MDETSDAHAPTPMGQLTRNVVGSAGVTYRYQVTKIVPIWNPRWPPWPPNLKIFFASSPEIEDQLSRSLIGSIGVISGSKTVKSFYRKSKMAAMTAILKIYLSMSVVRRQQFALKIYFSYLVDKKIAKPFRSEIQDGRHGRYLGSLFCTSSEPKGQLTRSLVESIRVTSRSKIAKLVLMGNPRWPPWTLS